MNTEFETAYEEAQSPYQFSEYRRERPTRRTQEASSGKDYLIRVIATQMLLFAILSAVLFGLYKKQSDTFLQLKTLYFSISEVDFSATEIMGALKSAAAFVFKPASGISSDTVTQSETTPETTVEALTAEDADVLTGAGGADIMQAKSSTSFAPISITAKAVLPVNGARITSRFGYRVNPITNAYGFHTGLDLAAPQGTEIFAAYSGTVIESETSAARGNYIVIEHSGGIKTVYCHCSAVFAEKGCIVRAGERIAAVGVTGQATGPHLHFEILINGVWCNPEWILNDL